MKKVEFWRFGGTPVPMTDVANIARRFEAQGWDGLVVGQDIGILPDSYLFLALAAAATTRLKVGTGVSVPLRNTMDVANTIAVLYAASGGRSLISFGRGDGGFAQIGRKPMRVAEFETYLRQVQSYLRKEDVDLDGFPSTMRSVYEIDPSLDGPKPLIDVSATGPKMIDLSARYADSITFAVGANLDRLRDCIKLARDARVAAGLDPDTLSIGCHIPAAVATGGVSVEDARNIIRGAVLRHTRFSAFDGTVMDGVSEQDREAVLRSFEVTRDHGRNMPKKADFSVASVLPDDFVDRFAIVGDPQQCADRFREVMSLGVDRILVLTRVPTTDREEGNAARLADTVLSQLA
ncbi:MAG: Luciferase-like, subgroup [Pseudonocardiales bacterium]|nr:Luciferase-like, subgroup [Pseudonocardiales bacterium]